MRARRLGLESRRRAPGRRLRQKDLEESVRQLKLWRYVRQISCPTIYILGGDSAIVPPETQAQLKLTIKGVTLEIIPGTGHYPDQEAPPAFMAIVERCLARIPTS